mgnify:FL=1
MKGIKVVVDGLDGVGKGEANLGIINYLESQGARVLDLHKYWAEHDFHPDFTNPVLRGRSNPFYVDLDSFDVLVYSEPTYVGIGKIIREEVTANIGRTYSARQTAELYSADRHVLIKRVELPVLDGGKTIIKSRSVATSIVYQPIQAEVQNEQGEQSLSIDDICKLEGNSFALVHAPNILIIPTLSDVEELMARLEGREKDDNCVFENLDLQLRFKPIYEGEVLRNIFQERGSMVEYLDASIPVESTRQQAVDIFRRII